MTARTKFDGGGIAATLALATGIAWTVLMAVGPGCTLRCDPGSEVDYDGASSPPVQDTVQVDPPAGAGVVDATTWESGPIDGTWLDYPGQRTFVLFPDLDKTFPGPYTSVEVYVSASPQANAPGSNWTLATGNLAEVSVRDPDADTGWGVVVTNNTCAPYFARVVVRRAAATGSGGADAGTD